MALRLGVRGDSTQLQCRAWRSAARLCEEGARRRRWQRGSGSCRVERCVCCVGDRCDVPAPSVWTDVAGRSPVSTEAAEQRSVCLVSVRIFLNLHCCCCITWPPTVWLWLPSNEMEKPSPQWVSPTSESFMLAAILPQNTRRCCSCRQEQLLGDRRKNSQRPLRA
jgi:hypothetical protein